MKYDWTVSEASGKLVAVLVGATAVAAMFGLFCGLSLPVGTDSAIAAGVLGAFLVWVGAACYAVLASDATRSWFVLLGIAVLLGAATVLDGIGL